MKAELGQREPQLLEQWHAMGLYSRRTEGSRGRPTFILHDGPPYANGQIHIGHALNKILKDFILKSKSMAGFHCPYIPGWDCHGLPIEHQVMKTLGKNRRTIPPLDIRQRCREYAEKFYRIQRDEFIRLGVLGDWEHPYLTMDPAYEAVILRELARMVKAGRVYQSKKPVLWCARDETALAEAEVEYAEHTSPSIYVKFPLVDTSGIDGLVAGEEASLLIWTTTPWTLAANRAISIHPDLTYRWVKTPAGTLLIAQDLLDPCLKALGFPDHEIRLLGEGLSGASLEGLQCRHPWLDLQVPVIHGEHVTRDQGTGCVHTAPGHGQEDYAIGLRYELEVFAPVDDQGRFLPEVKYFGGTGVLEANPEIIHLLKESGHLVREETITHSYPHCWRCKNPVIFRATQQWFVSMEAGDLRQNALAEIDAVQWLPGWGRERIYGMIQNRPDWCISRQRFWGVPIVSFRCRSCQGTLMNAEIIRKTADRIEEQGTDQWFSAPVSALLPKGTRCPQCQGEDLEKKNDILDVWFESGVSHAAVLKLREALRWPADLYLEGSDQHRGWFHSALLTALSTDGKAPYRMVLTHGFVVDNRGRKMSKSAGNVIAPQEVTDRHGAEILRLWVAAEDYRGDVRISQNILQQLVEAYRKIRNTCRFLLGNLYDYEPKQHRVADTDLWEVDRWALDGLQRLTERVRKSYDQYEFHTVFHTLNHFCAVEMSSLYLDILKDRLYTHPADSLSRRAGQRVLHEILTTLCKLMAPILSFTAEEVWQQLPASSRTSESIHLELFPMIEDRYRDEALHNRWEKLLTIRDEVARVLERARKERVIGSFMQAEVRLHVQGSLKDFLEGVLQDLPMLLIVAGVSLHPPAQEEEITQSENVDGLGIQVVRTPHSKCARCWSYRPTVGQSPEHPTLCDRCLQTVSQHPG